jgi:hypothetical protein
LGGIAKAKRILLCLTSYQNCQISRRLMNCSAKIQFFVETRKEIWRFNIFVILLLAKIKKQES